MAYSIPGPLLMAVLTVCGGVSCGRPRTVRYEGELAETARQYQASAGSWSCDSTAGAPLAQGFPAGADYVRCQGWQMDTLLGVLADSTGRVVALVLQIDVPRDGSAHAYSQLKEQLSRKAGPGVEWCEPHTPYLNWLWRAPTTHMVLLGDTMTGRINLSTVLGPPYCDQARMPR